MSNNLKFYIDGAWVDPIVPKTLDVIDPSTEQPFAKISVGAKADVDRAVAAAKRAFETFGYGEASARLDLLHRIVAIYKRPTRSTPRARPGWRISRRWPRC